ncbi:MAG: hypothetical protein QOI94_3522 [Acidobacteriaceae bacterium]|nr:hypothetical protein [Acidobacteriaceae bacterium]
MAEVPPVVDLVMRFRARDRHYTNRLTRLPAQGMKTVSTLVVYDAHWISRRETQRHNQNRLCPGKGQRGLQVLVPQFRQQLR